MRDLKQLQMFKSLSDRKGAVVDIDLIVAYLLFMGLIIIVVQLTLGLIIPFSTDFRTLSREKNIVSASELISTDFKSSDINDLCNEMNYSNIRTKSVKYNILGFFMPKKDADYSMPNLSSDAGVLFLRDNNYLRVMIGSNGSPITNVTLYLYMDYGTTVLNKSLESLENLSVYYDSLNNFVVKIQSRVSDGDIDEVLIGPFSKRTLVIPEVYNVSIGSQYVGDLRFNDSCGTRGFKGVQSSFTRYGTLMHAQEFYPIKINGDIWWTG